MMSVKNLKKQIQATLVDVARMLIASYVIGVFSESMRHDK